MTCTIFSHWFRKNVHRLWFLSYLHTWVFPSNYSKNRSNRCKTIYNAFKKNSPLYLQRVIFIFNENTCQMSGKSICNFKSNVQTEFSFEGNNWNCFMYTISKTVTIPYSDFFNRDAFSWITNLTSVMWSMFQFIFKRQTMFVQYIKNLYNNVLQTLSLQKYVNWCLLCHYISMAFECTETCWTIWLNKSFL